MYGLVDFKNKENEESKMYGLVDVKNDKMKKAKCMVWLMLRTTK